MKNKKLFNMGLIILIFIFNMLLIPSILYIFKITTPLLNVTLSTLFTIISYILILKKENESIKEIIVSNLILLLIILVSIFISGQIKDTTYDSNTYHKTAVGAIAKGWNPVYESAEEYYQSDKAIIHTKNHSGQWIDHYAKGYWIYAGNIYGVTENIETGKSIYFLLIFSTILIFIFTLKNKFSWISTILLSGLLAFNPITLSQFTSYYNDGLLGNLLIILILSLILMVKKNKILDKKSIYTLYFITLTILMNIKFTGLAYAGVFSFFFYVYILFNKEQRKENLKPLTIIAIISLIIGIFVIGLSTYPKNFKEHGNPFYPLYGEGKVDIMTTNTPTGFHEMNRIEKFLVSNFSKSYNTIITEKSNYKIKIPFTFSKEELESFIGTDIRVSGYGVWFSGILLLTIILFIYNLIKSIKEKREYAYYLVPILALTFLILILEESWWARYTPELYCFPILMLIVFNLQNENKTKLINTLFITLLIGNSILIAGPKLLDTFLQTIEVNKNINILKKINNDEELLIENEEFIGGIYNIYDKHKNIKIVESLEDKEKYTEYNDLMGRRVPIVGYVEE